MILDGYIKVEEMTKQVYYTKTVYFTQTRYKYFYQYQSNQ